MHTTPHNLIGPKLWLHGCIACPGLPRHALHAEGMPKGMRKMSQRGLQEQEQVAQRLRWRVFIFSLCLPQISGPRNMYQNQSLHGRCCQQLAAYCCGASL